MKGLLTEEDFKTIQNKTDSEPLFFYFESGEIYFKCLFKEGFLHCEDGPAMILYKIDGSNETKDEEEYINNE